MALFAVRRKSLGDINEDHECNPLAGAKPKWPVSFSVIYWDTGEALPKTQIEASIFRSGVLQTYAT